MPRGMRKLAVPVSVMEQQGLDVARVRSAVLRNSFFQYVQNFVFVANETQQATIAIQSDAHFLCVMTLYDTNGAAGAGVVPGLLSGGSLVQLTDASGQRFLSSNPVPASALFGTAQRPFVWPFTHLFRANGGITISTTGTTGAAQTVRYVFAGYKVPVGSIPELRL